MLIFCADSSGTSLSFCLAVEESDVRVLLGTVSYPAQGRMSDFFFSVMEQFLLANNRTVHDIDKWVVITGPGSFTGIRIGMAGISGICAALGKPLYGISALDAAALLSGKMNVVTAARLKFDEYALRSYDFISSKYSVLSIARSNELPEGAIMAGINMNLAESIADVRSERFIGEAAPLYSKRSEAEINFDKKSGF